MSALYRLQMGVAVCAILFTGSAATLVAMIIGLSLVCCTIHSVPVKTRRNAFGLILMLSAALVLLIPTGVWQHVAEESRSGDITLASIANTGLNSVRATPIGGYGAGAKSDYVVHSPGAHRLGFTMFAETGVLGVMSFLGLLWVLFLTADCMWGPTKSF